MPHDDAIPDDLPRLPYDGGDYETLRVDVTVADLMDGTDDLQSHAFAWGDAVARFARALDDPPERPPAFADHTPAEIRRTRIGECADGLADPDTDPDARRDRLRTAKETLLVLQSWVLAEEGRLTEFGYDPDDD